jgi:hypothetical protein
MPWAAATAVGLAVIEVILNGLPRIAGVGLLAAYGSYVVLMA